MSLFIFLSPMPILKNTPINHSLITVSAATYPTKWVKMSTHTANKKYARARDAATAAVIGASIKNLKSTPKILSPSSAFLSATAGFVKSLYNQRKDANVYYSITYHYRELGKGRYDSIGNYLGNYEVRQTLKSYKNSARTQLISANTTYTKTTTLMPWMY